jgi:hypothetical protein
MFRRIRHKKWLVAGLGVAALVIPTTALAGNNYGAKDSWYGYAVSQTRLSQSQLPDGRSPDTKDAAAVAATSNLDPAIVGYLTRYGFTKSQIEAWSQPLKTQQSLDPAIVKYLVRYGFTQSQIAAMSGGTYKAAASQSKFDPAIVKYLERYGYTPSQIAAMSGGAFHVSKPALVDGRSPDTIDFGVQAHQPVVTVVRDPGFQWGDFGIGLSAALLALVLITMMRVLTKDRSERRPATSS